MRYGSARLDARRIWLVRLSVRSQNKSHAIITVWTQIWLDLDAELLSAHVQSRSNTRSKNLPSNLPSSLTSVLAM
jgi:hypothetical protein